MNPLTQSDFSALVACQLHTLGIDKYDPIEFRLWAAVCWSQMEEEPDAGRWAGGASV